jgi:glycosyltransferase involved in cell wall biosynthesis
MSCSITIVIPNRNRDLHTVKRSLDSIDPQLTEGTKLVIIDYGSQVNYQSQLKKLTSSFSGIDLILCPTQGQLWNKAR